MLIWLWQYTELPLLLYFGVGVAVVISALWIDEKVEKLWKEHKK